MTLTSWQKNAAIIAAAVTVAAGVVAGREKPALEISQEKAAKPAADDGIDLGKLRRPEASAPLNDPFSSGFQEPKPQVAAVADKPVVPPLPFRYFGRLTENGKTEVFVMQGDALLAIAAGQTIGDYRVDKIADAGISFTYLPMKTKQTLDLQ